MTPFESKSKIFAKYIATFVKAVLFVERMRPFSKEGTIQFYFAAIQVSRCYNKPVENSCSDAGPAMGIFYNKFVNVSDMSLWPKIFLHRQRTKGDNVFF